MNINHSPWLTQLRKDRVLRTLEDDMTTDVTIIGAGIAGIATAFFTLKYTDKHVLLLEKYRLAHGATGHNAGQVVSYFERGFASLAEEFGLPLAAEGQKNIEDAWNLLDEMYADAGLTIPFSKFTGHAALSSYEQVLFHLKNNLYRQRAGLPTEQMIISEHAGFLSVIPDEYKELYEIVPAETIQSTLETHAGDFVAVLSYQKGCVNSALFCEEVMLYLLRHYPDRFAFREMTPVKKIILRDGSVTLDACKHTVNARNVILCTNGFTGFTIINESGLELNSRFHHMVHGTIGYMSGYLEKSDKAPTAISYLSDPDPDPKDPYFYLTRRRYEYQGTIGYNLVSIGGPESMLGDQTTYSPTHEYPEEITKKIDSFVRHIYGMPPDKKIDYVFTWHGLMGYTENGVRMVGPEPENPVLLYNLGCNGIGILPSVYGGKRVSEFLSGKTMGRSIFDVPVNAQ